MAEEKKPYKKTESEEQNLDNELLNSVLEGNVKLAQYCVEHKADITKILTGEETYLHLAAYCGQNSIIKWLIGDQSFSPMEIDYNGNTPAHRAAQTGETETVELLRSLGARLDTRNHDGNSVEDLLSLRESQHNTTIEEGLQEISSLLEEPQETGTETALPFLFAEGIEGQGGSGSI